VEGGIPHPVRGVHPGKSPKKKGETHVPWGLKKNTPVKKEGFPNGLSLSSERNGGILTKKKKGLVGNIGGGTECAENGRW